MRIKQLKIIKNQIWISTTNKQGHRERLIVMLNRQGKKSEVNGFYNSQWTCTTERYTPTHTHRQQAHTEYP